MGGFYSEVLLDLIGRSLNRTCWQLSKIGDAETPEDLAYGLWNGTTFRCVMVRGETVSAIGCPVHGRQRTKACDWQ